MTDDQRPEPGDIVETDDFIEPGDVDDQPDPSAGAPIHLDRVVVPLGVSLVDAAAWVGRSCWIELRLHEELTSWLTDEGDAAWQGTLWSVRSRRGELAERWHRRLPELREMPRAGFVEPDDAAEACVERLSEPPPATSDQRRARLREVLSEVTARYREHLELAVGPADGSTARTLAEAIAATDLDVAALAPPPN